MPSAVSREVWLATNRVPDHMVGWTSIQPAPEYRQKDGTYLLPFKQDLSDCATACHEILQRISNAEKDKNIVKVINSDWEGDDILSAEIRLAGRAKGNQYVFMAGNQRGEVDTMKQAYQVLSRILGDGRLRKGAVQGTEKDAHGDWVGWTFSDGKVTLLEGSSLTGGRLEDEDHEKGDQSMMQDGQVRSGKESKDGDMEGGQSEEQDGFGSPKEGWKTQVREKDARAARRLASVLGKKSWTMTDLTSSTLASRLPSITLHHCIARDMSAATCLFKKDVGQGANRRFNHSADETINNLCTGFRIPNINGCHPSTLRIKEYSAADVAELEKAFRHQLPLPGSRESIIFNLELMTEWATRLWGAVHREGAVSDQVTDACVSKLREAWSGAALSPSGTSRGEDSQLEDLPDWMRKALEEKHYKHEKQFEGSLKRLGALNRKLACLIDCSATDIAQTALRGRRVSDIALLPYQLVEEDYTDPEGNTKKRSHVVITTNPKHPLLAVSKTATTSLADWLSDDLVSSLQGVKDKNETGVMDPSLRSQAQRCFRTISAIMQDCVDTLEVPKNSIRASQIREDHMEEFRTCLGTAVEGPLIGFLADQEEDARQCSLGSKYTV